MPDDDQAPFVFFARSLNLGCRSALQLREARVRGLGKLGDGFIATGKGKEKERGARRFR